MGPIVVMIVLALVALFIIAKTAVVVPQQSAFVVERLGRYSGTLGAGFHILVPFMDVVRYRHSLKEMAFDIPEQVCITRDNVQVSVDGILYIKVLIIMRFKDINYRTIWFFAMLIIAAMIYFL